MYAFRHMFIKHPAYIVAEILAGDDMRNTNTLKSLMVGAWYRDRTAGPMPRFNTVHAVAVLLTNDLKTHDKRYADHPPHSA